MLTSIFTANDRNNQFIIEIILHDFFIEKI